jgi:xylulokinase
MMAQAPLFLALDAGTTSFKAILFDAAGHVLAHERAEIRLHHPRPLWAEVDAGDWWRAAVERVPHLFNHSGAAPGAVAAVGVTGAMHALVPVGADGAVLGPTLTWFDQRCRPQVEALQERAAAVFEPVGGISIASSAARLRWLQEEMPELVERTHCFLLPKDLLRQRLTGRFGTDASDARSTSMVDRRTGDWCHALIEEVLQVPAGKLPEIRPATEIAGPVTEPAATALGLRAGTPVVVGMGDVPATLLGIGAFRAGQLSVYLGTGGWMARTLPSESDTTPATAWVGSTLACGSAFNWARHLLFRSGETGAAADYEAIEQAVASVPAGSDGLFFLPHLMGERGRCSDPDARGTFYGLTLAHTPAHLLRAVIEGIAFQFQREIDAATRASTDEIRPSHPEHKASASQPPPEETITLSGGAARSEQWRRIIAAVTGRRVDVPAVADSTVLGAAIVAAVAAGHLTSLRTGAAAWVRPGVRVEPDAGAAGLYASVYERYCALQAALEPLSARFAADR